jgi:hypothetical protein
MCMGGDEGRSKNFPNPAGAGGGSSSSSREGFAEPIQFNHFATAPRPRSKCRSWCLPVSLPPSIGSSSETRVWRISSVATTAPLSSRRSFRFGAGADVDASRLQLFRHLAHQVDHEQIVFDIRSGDPHMVSQIETLLKAQRNALVKQLRLLALLTRDQQRSPRTNSISSAAKPATVMVIRY